MAFKIKETSKITSTIPGSHNDLNDAFESAVNHLGNGNVGDTVKITLELDLARSA
jgi:hypothetical protein